MNAKTDRSTGAPQGSGRCTDRRRKLRQNVKADPAVESVRMAIAMPARMCSIHWNKSIGRSAAFWRIAICAIVLGLFMGRWVEAGIVNFESVPGVGIPTELMIIDTQYRATLGVTFGLEGGGAPVIGSVGGPETSFLGFGGLPDQPIPGSLDGRFFITDDGKLNNSPIQPLIVRFEADQAFVGAVILDIDYFETWTVRALNRLDVVIDMQTVSYLDSGTGNAVATHFQFAHQMADIATVRFEYIGDYAHDVGFAFDNFAFTDTPGTNPTVPEPSCLLLIVAGLAFTGVAERAKLQGRSSQCNS